MLDILLLLRLLILLQLNWWVRFVVIRNLTGLLLVRHILKKDLVLHHHSLLIHRRQRRLRERVGIINNGLVDFVFREHVVLDLGSVSSIKSYVTDIYLGRGVRRSGTTVKALMVRNVTLRRNVEGTSS